MEVTVKISSFSLDPGGLEVAGIVLAHNALPFQMLPFCHADGNSLITTLATYDVVMTYPLGNHNSTATTISLLKTAITCERITNPG